MGFKGLFAATASVALMATPTLAAAQQAAPTSEISPAGEKAGGSELRGGFIIPLIAIIAIILGIIAATHKNHNLPTSP